MDSEKARDGLKHREPKRLAKRNAIEFKCKRHAVGLLSIPVVLSDDEVTFAFVTPSIIRPGQATRLFVENK